MPDPVTFNVVREPPVKPPDPPPVKPSPAPVSPNPDPAQASGETPPQVSRPEDAPGYQGPYAPGMAPGEQPNPLDSFIVADDGSGDQPLGPVLPQAPAGPPAPAAKATTAPSTPASKPVTPAPAATPARPLTSQERADAQNLLADLREIQKRTDLSEDQRRTEIAKTIKGKSEKQLESFGNFLNQPTPDGQPASPELVGVRRNLQQFLEKRDDGSLNQLADTFANPENKTFEGISSSYRIPIDRNGMSGPTAGDKRADQAKKLQDGKGASSDDAKLPSAVVERRARLRRGLQESLGGQAEKQLVEEFQKQNEADIKRAQELGATLQANKLSDAETKELGDLQKASDDFKTAGPLTTEAQAEADKTNARLTVLQDKKKKFDDALAEAKALGKKLDDARKQLLADKGSEAQRAIAEANGDKIKRVEMEDAFLAQLDPTRPSDFMKVGEFKAMLNSERNRDAAKADPKYLARLDAMEKVYDARLTHDPAKFEAAVRENEGVLFSSDETIDTVNTDKSFASQLIKLNSPQAATTAAAGVAPSGMVPTPPGAATLSNEKVSLGDKSQTLFDSGTTKVVTGEKGVLLSAPDGSGVEIRGDRYRAFRQQGGQRIYTTEEMAMPSDGSTIAVDGSGHYLKVEKQADNTSRATFCTVDDHQTVTSEQVVTLGKDSKGGDSVLVAAPMQTQKPFEVKGTPLYFNPGDGNLYRSGGYQKYFGPSAPGGGYPNGPAPTSGSPGENWGFNPNDGLAQAAEASKNKMMEYFRKSKRERDLDQLIAMLCGGGGGPIGPGGYGPGGFGGGEGFGLGVQGGPGFFGAQGAYQGPNYGINAGFDNQGHWNVGGSYLGKNFGFSIELGNGGGCLPGGRRCAFGGYVMDFETLLLAIMTILEEEEREKIGGIIKRMRDAQKDLKGITADQARERPGLVQSLNTDTSILQIELSMAVQNRQKLIETVTNTIKSAFDAKMNSVRRIV